MMESLIAWLKEYIGHLPSTIALSWTALASVLGHSRPSFSLFLPVQSSLFVLPWVVFCFIQCVQNARGRGVNNFFVALLFANWFFGYHFFPTDETTSRHDVVRGQLRAERGVVAGLCAKDGDPGGQAGPSEGHGTHDDVGFRTARPGRRRHRPWSGPPQS